MKVILLSDVPKLGTRGTVADVADGYARNFLFPRKLADEATKGALARLEEQNRARARREAEDIANAEETARLIEGANLRVAVKAGGNGRLFGTVTNAQIAEAIQTQHNVTIDRHKIEIKDGIKAVGTYPVSVRLGKSIVAETSVQIVAG